MGKKIMTLMLVLGFSLFATTALGLAAGPPPIPTSVQLPAHGVSYFNVPYIPGTKNPKQMLDIYMPLSPKPAGGYPLLIYVHGGGFAVGDKYAPADRYLKANAAKYDINVKKVAIMGVSAGASIASAVATSSDSTAFDAELAALGVAKTPDDVTAAVSLFGLFNFNNLEPQFKWLTDPADTSFDKQYLPTYANDRKFYVGKKPPLYNDPKAFEYKALGGAFESKQDVIKMVNAETYIGTNEPPFFIRHGNNDHALPFLQSVDFANALKAKGNKVDFAIVPDAQHGLPGMNFFQKFDVKEMYDWLAANL